MEPQCKQCIKHLFLAFLLPGAIFLALMTRNSYEITVATVDGSVIVVESSWWGLNKNSRKIRWMKTKDYDYSGWMTKDNNGGWYLYLTEE